MKINKIKINTIIYSLMLLLSINIIYAQTDNPLKEINVLVGGTNSLALRIIGLLNIVAMITYIVLVISYLWKRSHGDNNGLEQMKGMLLWGVVGMFFLVAVWGMTFFLSTTLGIKVGGCTQLPAAPGQAVNTSCNNSGGGIAAVTTYTSPSVVVSGGNSNSGGGIPQSNGTPNPLGVSSSNIKNPYTGIEALIFDNQSETSKQWLIKNGGRPVLTDACILLRSPDGIKNVNVDKKESGSCGDWVVTP